MQFRDANDSKQMNNLAAKLGCDRIRHTRPNFVSLTHYVDEIPLRLLTPIHTAMLTISYISRPQRAS